MKLILILVVIFMIFKWKRLNYFFKALTILMCLMLIKAEKDNDLYFFFEEPATCWEETFPLGNGRLGIMPDGGIEKEKIVLNDITLWSGKVADYSNPKAKEALPEIQRLLLEDKNYEAQELVYKTFTCSNKGSNWGNGALSNFGCFQTLGNINIDYIYDDAKVKDGSYVRKLDLNNAIATTEFETEQAKFCREYFVSREADVALIRLDADKSKMISVEIQLNREECVEYSTEDNSIVMYGQLKDGSDGDDGMKYLSKVTVNNVGGEVEYKDNKIIVRNADRLTIIFSSATNYKNNDYTALVDSLMNEAKSRNYVPLRKKHIKAYHELFDRVEVDFGESITENHPINDRLNDFQEEDDPHFAEL
jgi:alpha-L-fucosidase 2